ncbi:MULTISPECIES: NAD-dependent protein deacylase [unclassified Enterococcus]|uniref:NAD-dependent protein deacylase n=1 Tax=unclassified Enterococcus TaxID=2608891 RepID=UPI001551F3AA|nr:MULTISPECIES: NAD-dependent protein deacylase [unclassified Enterococcus]MBS7577043.1 NAD-dependent protein deacylase [Enterococcus sp. MMGLQ5-2]MBS7584510.1 NAD-dependent protein deacylase [Enterococcus sp. MMGLQ5-1]NPD12365.1 NAD-dependent protein deacylase [Enterococcus sp. MMGLQ5-1]NPD36877.1 NAD-dependent protein deacylase [Enterococcus sp. MMGLQ5-2]
MIILNNKERIVNEIKSAENLVFLTGAGVSTLSGIPDYRSKNGIYSQFKERPEYLLSHEAMINEPAKFYRFMKMMYYPDAKPNLIHKKLALIERHQNSAIITQNIDGLHQQAGAKKVIAFHGSLYNVYCRKCGATVPYQVYLESAIHQKCDGQLRPDIVLYGEGIKQGVVDSAMRLMQNATTVVVLGTSFVVYPFASLANAAKPNTQFIVINEQQVELPFEHLAYIGNAKDIMIEL